MAKNKCINQLVGFDIMIETSLDKYGGVIINSATLPFARDEFEKEIKSLVASLKDKKLVWI